MCNDTDFLFCLHYHVHILYSRFINWLDTIMHISRVLEKNTCIFNACILAWLSLFSFHNALLVIA